MADNPSSRQKIRKALLILSFLLIPVTVFYVSPLVIMMGSAAGIVTGSFVHVVLLFLVSLIAGRLWCGWLCPMGAWQEICSPLTKRTVPEGWPDWIKYAVTALWLGMIGFTFRQAGGIRAVDLTYGTVNGLSISSVQVLVMVAMIFGSILAVAFIAGRRGFCHVLCPIAGIMVAGRKIRNLAGWPALRLDADAAKCTDCMTCSQVCPMGLDVNGMVRKGEMRRADCILCASCADAGPQGAITCGVQGK